VRVIQKSMDTGRQRVISGDFFFSLNPRGAVLTTESQGYVAHVILSRSELGKLVEKVLAHPEVVHQS